MSFLEKLAVEVQTAEQSRSTVGPQVKERSVDPLLSQKRNALRYRQESGIGLMVQRLGLILASDMVSFEDGGKIKTVSRGASKGPDYEVKAITDYEYPLEHPDRPRRIPEKDKDTAITDIAYWLDLDHNREPIDGRVNYIGTVSFGDGCVGFYTWRFDLETIQASAWRNNPELLEETLGKSFENPATHFFDSPAVKRLARECPEYRCNPLEGRSSPYLRRGPGS